MDNVNNWHIFKAVCERTQNKLQSLNNKGSSQLEEVGIFSGMSLLLSSVKNIKVDIYLFQYIFSVENQK